MQEKKKKVEAKQPIASPGSGSRPHHFPLGAPSCGRYQSTWTGPLGTPFSGLGGGFIWHSPFGRALLLFTRKRSAATATWRPHKGHAQGLVVGSASSSLPPLMQGGQAPASWPGPQGRIPSFLGTWSWFQEEPHTSLSSILLPFYALLSLNRTQVVPSLSPLFRELPFSFLWQFSPL